MEYHGAQLVAGILDLHTPEVHGEDVERRLRCALKDAPKATGEGVRAGRGHRVEQESAAAGRVEWPKDCDWQRIHDLITHVEGVKDPLQYGREHVEQSTVSEKRDRDKHAEDIRENNAPDFQPVVRAFDERLEDRGALCGELLLAQQAVTENYKDKAEQHRAREVAREIAFADQIQPRDINEQNGDNGGDSANCDHKSGLKQIDPLANADDYEGRNRAD